MVRIMWHPLTSPGSSGPSSLCLRRPPFCPVPLSSRSHSLSVLLLLFLLLHGPTLFLPVFPSPQSSLLPFLPSSWSHLSPLPLGPTSHLSHLLLFLPSTVLPVPPPSAPLGARLFAAFALAGPLCLEHPSAILHLATPRHPSNLSFRRTSEAHLLPQIYRTTPAPAKHCGLSLCSIITI